MRVCCDSVLLRTFATLSFSTATLTVIAASVVHSAVLATVGYLYFRKREVSPPFAARPSLPTLPPANPVHIVGRLDTEAKAIGDTATNRAASTHSSR